MPSSFKAFIAENGVAKEVLRPFSNLQSSQLRIKIHAAGANRADILQIRGLYPGSNFSSDILGLEFAGEVVECAPGSKYKVSDRVIGLVDSGAYAEFLDVEETNVSLLPDTISYEVGAAIPESWATAYFNIITKARLLSNEKILIHSAAGGVGLAATQIANHFGAEVIASVGSVEKVRTLKSLGVETIFSRLESDPNKNGMAQLSNRYLDSINVVLDTVGAKYLPMHCDLLAMNGRLLLIGLLGGGMGDIDLSFIIRKNLSIFGSTMRTQSIETKAIFASMFSEFVLPSIESGSFKPFLSKVFKFSEIAEAHKYILENKNIGNVVLSWH